MSRFNYSVNPCVTHMYDDSSAVTRKRREPLDPTETLWRDFVRKLKEHPDWLCGVEAIKSITDAELDALFTSLGYGKLSDRIKLRTLFAKRKDCCDGCAAKPQDPILQYMYIEENIDFTPTVVAWFCEEADVENTSLGQLIDQFTAQFMILKPTLKIPTLIEVCIDESRTKITVRVAEKQP